jgi:hypothetical protein
VVYMAITLRKDAVGSGEIATVSHERLLFVVQMPQSRTATNLKCNRGLKSLSGKPKRVYQSGERENS